MNFIIVSNYYYPELGAAPNRITNLAKGLSDENNNVSVLCPLPNYPKGKIFDNYTKSIRCREVVGGVNLYRYWIYPSVSKNVIARIISMLSFAISLWGFLSNTRSIKRTDWVIIQNSPLLVSFSSIILFKKVFSRKIALNVSDLWPLSALELGAIKRGKFYNLLEWIEKFNYKNSDLIIGQSQEILDHTEQIVEKPTFLYRNIQPATTSANQCKDRTNGFKIVYAGLLGVAQGIYKIVEQINFAELGIEFDIYGHGNEERKIIDFLQNNKDRGISYKGSISKKELDTVLPEYHASIVPLVNRIKGAVPSKIYELMQLNVPVIFCGGGEGAKIIEEYKTGITVTPGNLKELRNAIVFLKTMNDNDYHELIQNCQRVAKNNLNFNQQIKDLLNSLNNVK